MGPAREQELLKRFGSLEVIRRASVEQLARTPGIGETTAAAILAALTDDEEGVGPAAEDS